jgi:predicted NAD/FAD-dependent oxidoreductase
MVDVLKPDRRMLARHQGVKLKKVVILGGGFAGLSTAPHLQKAGRQDYHILGKDSRIGGLTRSEPVGGFTFDYTDHVLHFTDQANKQLVLQLLGDNIHCIPWRPWLTGFTAFGQIGSLGVPCPIWDVADCLPTPEKITVAVS